MKRFLILLMAGWFFLPASSPGAETAHARFYCVSLHFSQGTTYGGTLDLSTIGGPPYNGELLPYSGDTWASSFALYYGGYGYIYGTMYVNLPAAVDVNGNGFDDFFEVLQGVGTTVTSGSYNTGISSGTILATWNRPAGSKNGTCVMNLNDDVYGNLGNYSCPFELIEYTGPLIYTPGSNTVSASINLTQTGNSARTLQGAITFVKSTVDRFNTLTNQPGVWTNTASQTLSFASQVFLRGAPAWPTNYAGYIGFADGDPSTASPDYQWWVLSIDDTNDVNANGVPDFSDDPTAAPPRAPHLSLTLGSTNVLLKISGDVGHTNQIQEISALISTNWLTTQSFKLTNDPQVVSLPLPAGTVKFWRVVAQ